MVNRKQLNTRRPQKNRQPVPIIYAVVEGRSTEKQYIEFVRDRLPNRRVLSIQPKWDGSSTREMAKQAKQLLKVIQHVPNATVWIICDVDEEAPQIEDARTDLSGYRQLHWAISNPCIDVWLLFHETFSGASVMGKPARDTLNTRVESLSLVTGKKRKDLVLGALMGKAATVQQNAERSRAEHARHERVFPENNPGSDLDLFLSFVVEQYNSVRPPDSQELNVANLY